MLNKFLDNYAINYKRLSLEQQQELTDQFFNLFYNDETELISRLKELKEQSYTDEEIFEILKNETNLDFWCMALQTFQLENISGLIKMLCAQQKDGSELLSLIKNPEGLKRSLSIQKSLAECQLKAVFGIHLENKTREESKILTKKIFFTTKERIAAEFGCSKRTLLKWLEICFGDRFKRKGRKITIEEYIEIFEAFFSGNDENLDLNNDLNKYLNRIEKGNSFSKSDLAELCYSDLKTQKENLKKIAFYRSVDKFPYSICKELADKMGYPLEF
ncbi:hypothetical protein [Flavobacterium notoginsengisoli]|uniref:hypothetical protein n=1 Tax=Flavobacterium notoginsengisoli TaxID=1478199 RepID=UPI003638DFF5